MSRNDDRTVGHPEEPTPGKRGTSDESERLQQPGAGARVTGVHGVGAPDVTDHDVPARKPGRKRVGSGETAEKEDEGSGI
jgi:hypothetical protein